MTNSLKMRLVITGIALCVLVAVASTALFYTAKQYNFHIERSTRAQHVYASYRAVSDHTYRKLSALGQIVEEGTLTNLQQRYQNKEALRNALKEVRDSIAAELTHVGELSEAAELEHFNKIELLAEEIIRGSELVRIAVQDKKPAVASAALEKLRSYEVEGSFIRLIDVALAEELREVRETQLLAQELNTILTRLLSLILVLFLLFGAYLLLTTWRSLSSSLLSFEEAADAYQAGIFSHRVPTNLEKEFLGLSVALNKMASEVEAQREKEKTTQENLEALIASRTIEMISSNKKLEMVNETRKQFLADISHELRTPLTIIQGEADFVLRNDTSTSDEYIAALRRIKEQTTHTTRFVQDLLFVARAEDGKAPMHRRLTDIVPLIADVCEDFSVIAQQKNINVVHSHPDHQLMASVDVSHIKQVITILLDNAVRYSYNNSEIHVSVSTNSNNLIISVSDSGIGLSYNESSQVFSRFYRGSVGSGKASGTGLGLPVAKAIVDAHGGSLDLEGKSGDGTTATIMLPMDSDMRAIH